MQDTAFDAMAAAGGCCQQVQCMRSQASRSQIMALRSGQHVLLTHTAQAGYAEISALAGS